MRYLLGVDLGTSGTKTVLFEQTGKAVASKTVEYPLLQPKNGWAEQKPSFWYEATIESIRDVIKQSGINSEDIAGLSIAGQMHGLVMLDKEGTVLRDAILWCDARTQKQCDEITALVGKQRLIEINANPALTGFTAPKILWVRENEPQIYEKCATVLLPKDYVRYMLTGRLAMEISDASGTNLLDITKRQWSDEILEKLSIDKSLLPPIIESSDVAGHITAKVAELTGLKEGTIVAGGAGDNAAAALGTGVCREGDAFVTLGTSGVIFAHTSKPSIDPLGRVHTFCSAVKDSWTAMSCTLAAGLSLRWLRDEMFAAEKKEEEAKGSDVYNLMTDNASKIPVGSDGLLYLPYLMGERSPVLDPNARGVFFGLTARHTRAHMTRAVLEGITLSQRHNLEVLHEMDIVPKTLTACGGGAQSPFWRQLLSDALKCTIVTTNSKEGPALGAAILAGVAAGIFRSVEEGCSALVSRSDKKSEPNDIECARYDDIYKMYSFLYPCLRPAFAKLATLRDRLDGADLPDYKEVTDIEFERYGKVVEDIPTDSIIELLEQTPMTEGTDYKPSVELLERPDLKKILEEQVFGGLKIQVGYCNGHNRDLNALEYHRNSELNIAANDALLMVAPMTAVHDGIIDTNDVEIFRVRRGQAVLFYETTLHYAPCVADNEEHFRMAVVLPKDTNTDRPEDVYRLNESGYLTHNNKWLFAHKDSPEGRAKVSTGRLIGTNLSLR
ncbi:MAG: xylulokinase [Succinivibrio sp.]